MLSGSHFPVIFSLLLAVISTAGTLYMPILIGRAIDLILGEGRVDFARMIPLLKQGAAIIIVTAASQWLMNLCNNKIAYHLARDLRNEAMAHIGKLPLSYIDSHSHGDTVSRIITDVDQIADGLLMGFTQFFTGVLTIIATLAFIFSIHPGIALLVICLSPLSLLVARFISSRTYTMFQKQSETRGEQTALIEELMEGQKVVKAFGYEETAKIRFANVNERLAGHSLRAIFYSSLTNPCTRFVNSIVYAGVALSGAMVVISGGLTVGSLTCLLSYATQYTKPFNEISGVITELQNSIACTGRVMELIEEEPEKESGFEEISQTEGNVTFSHINFSYIPEKPLIEDLNLAITSGQRVAIVGPTGSGKTTLINLLMRFYEIDGGKISLDGRDIRSLTRKSLRSMFGMVLQETWLKTGTVRDNITMGRDGFSEEEIIAAAKRSRAYDFIRRMPNGLDTRVSEESTTMSQGQKQLLCITRIMLDLPPLLILDEATSSIDTRTEMLIQQAFSDMMKGRTSFIVAHRLSTIENADVILVLKDGHVIEQGTHQSLLSSGGFYASLYASQFAV